MSAGARAACAILTDTSSTDAVIAEGTLHLASEPSGDASLRTHPLAPGDAVARTIDLGLEGSAWTDVDVLLTVAASPSSLLDSDPVNGLRLSFQACSAPWRPPTRATSTRGRYTCDGDSSIVTLGGLSSASVASLEDAPTRLGNVVTDGDQAHLLATLTLPRSAPGDPAREPLCSGTAGGTNDTEDLQGCSSVLTYEITASHRTVKRPSP